MPKFCSGLFGFLNRVTVPTLTPGSKDHQDDSTYYVNLESTTPWQYLSGDVENGLPTEPVTEDFQSSTTVSPSTDPNLPVLPQGRMTKIP